MLLVGDIGGTHTRLAVYTPQAGPRAPLAGATFSSARYPSLEAIAEAFLSQTGMTVTAACFDVAGPVVAGRAKVTNLPWLIDSEQFRQRLGLSFVHLMNDLEAIASGIPILEADDLEVLKEGRPLPGGAIAVIAPGTGLGEGFLVWDGSQYRAQPSEGSHADFAPTDEQQVGLLRYLLARLDHVSYERVCSGIGLPNLYAYLKETGYAEEPDWLARRLAEATDPTPVIVAAALDPEQPSPLCAAALDLFVAILGAEAGNLALKVMATGGVYLGGGIPPHILPALRGERFRQAFLNKGRFRDLLAGVPIYVILNPQAALIGAARCGLSMMADG
jgi:glucokinase